MQQQESNFKQRAEKWADANGFKLIPKDERTVVLQRLSDGHPINVDKRLLNHIMTDEGF